MKKTYRRLQARSRLERRLARLVEAPSSGHTTTRVDLMRVTEHEVMVNSE
jgi:hypothetical protein